MRVRAERIGAKLRVLSRLGEGTATWNLSVPARIAFVSPHTDEISKWFSRFSPRRKNVTGQSPTERRQ